MRNLKDKVAVVTGAGSGIGRATALALAREGCRLAVSDINKETVEETRQAIVDAGGEAKADVLDVADRDAVHKYADDVVAHFGAAHIVVNNAGVALSATIERMSYQDLEWLLGINFWGVIHGTKAFLPHLRTAGEGHIVNISSVFGLFAVPTQSAYHCAKFAVRGFTECLRQELEIEEANIGVTSVHPGGIKTNIVRNSRKGELGDFFERPKDDMVTQFDKMARTTPEKAAETILNGIKKNKRRVLIGPDARVLDFVQRCIPAGYQWVLVRLQRSGRGI